MHILCIAATKMELAELSSNHHAIDFLVSGIGVPSTIFHLMKKLNEKKYDLVVQVGIAGSFNAKLIPGEPVLVSEEYFADLGMVQNGRFSTLFERGFLPEDDFPYSKGKLINNNVLLEDAGFKKVSGITVNTVTDNMVQINILKASFKADIETMEGAALHYTCLLQNIPFLQLRSVSNFVGERDRSQWKISEALVNLSAAFHRLTKICHDNFNPYTNKLL